MAIKAKNIVNKSEPKPQEEIPVAEAPKMKSSFRDLRKKEVIEAEREKQRRAKYKIEKKEVKGVASTETALLVNGKQKSIGRKSHYLLDMLTLDDE